MQRDPAEPAADAVAAVSLQYKRDTQSVDLKAK